MFHLDTQFTKPNNQKEPKTDLSLQKTTIIQHVENTKMMKIIGSDELINLK